MAKKKGTSYEDLIEEALVNAAEDRSRAVDAFEKTKKIYDVDFQDAESWKALMLLGQSIPKLLELANKSNEQIIKLAQLREKEDSRVKKKEVTNGPISFADVKDIIEKGKKAN